MSSSDSSTVELEVSGRGAARVFRPRVWMRSTAIETAKVVGTALTRPTSAQGTIRRRRSTWRREGFLSGDIRSLYPLPSRPPVSGEDAHSPGPDEAADHDEHNTPENLLPEDGEDS